MLEEELYRFLSVLLSLENAGELLFIDLLGVTNYFFLASPGGRVSVRALAGVRIRLNFGKGMVE